MKKIMIVDDEAMTRRLTSRVLEKAGYVTVQVSSGEEAIDIYESEKPDLILLDIRMPGMSGYDTFLEMRERFGEGVIVIFLTSDDEEESESRGLSIGAKDYINKPLKPAVLLKRIESILQSKDAFEEARNAAERDSLTGLLNRAGVEEAMGRILKLSPKGILLMMDIDSFKLVNDLYSHDMGDKILVRFAEIIKSKTRNDDMIGRLGGDEFIAFINGLGQEERIKAFAKDLNRELIEAAKDLMGEDFGIPLGASLGAVSVNGKNLAFDELYKMADQALYHVKENGKAGIAFYEGSEASKASTEEGDEPRKLSSIKKIYSERNMESGAYVVGNDAFTSIYRFMCRYKHNYGVDFSFIQIILEGNAPQDANKGDLYEHRERLLELVRHSLRSSDVITRQGKEQILVLMPYKDDNGVETVVLRVRTVLEEALKDSNISVRIDSDWI